MKIELWPIDRVIPYIRNARKISNQAIDKVASSIKEYGFRQPIVVDRADVIIAGHTRLLAARKLGLTTVPVHVAHELTPAQVKAYRIMDNRSHEETDWDSELLLAEFEELKDLGVDSAETGFDAREIDDLQANVAADEEEEHLPDGPVHPVTIIGDLWRCGEHRIHCGDATSPNAVSRLLNGTKPLLMSTDPPYGVNYDPRWRMAHDGGGRHALGRIQNDDRVDWTPALQLFPGDIAYVWHAGVHASEVATSLVSIGFEIRAQIIWAKQHFVFGRGNYHWQHEPCWFAVRQGKNSRWRGDRTQSTLWEVANLNPHGGNREEQPSGHSTQKPVELMRRPIVNHTEPGETMYDPFLGSGTSLLAAEKTNRLCYGMDIDPQYVDLAIVRWQEATRRTATLDGDGRTFEEITQERMRLAEAT
jgi:DNA modification methylase